MLRNQDVKAKSKALFSVRPVFIGWVVLLKQLPRQLFMTIWAGLFFGGFITVSGLFPRGSPTPFIVAGAIAFFGIPAVTYFGNKLNFSRTNYRFYPGHLEFEEGFFTINKKVIRFRDVKEVTLHKSMFQRLYGIGSIYLATLATGSSPSNLFVAFGFGNVSASGVVVRDIRHPDEVFESIRQLVDAHNDTRSTD